MGQPGPVQVEADRLETISAAVADVSGDLDGAITRRAGGLAPGGDGWACVAAAESASKAWAGHVRQLSRSVDEVAGDLRAAAEGYRAADQAAARRITGAGRRLPR